MGAKTPQGRADILVAMRYAMIMAGGAGTRLWPLSRKQRPKQLLRFIRLPDDRQAHSLLELAAARLEGLVVNERRFICTGEAYRGAVKETIAGITDERILGEPMGRDTLNAVGFAAAVFHKLDPNAIFAVLTADHIISPNDLFKARMDLGFKLVEKDPHRLVTFSIKPTHAATGYGYVERGAPVTDVDGCNEGGTQLAFNVARFVEKPDKHRAEAYVQSGMFGWNSGMFVFHAGTMLECIEKFQPEAYTGLQRIQKAWGTDDQQTTLLEVYPKLPKISIDYAIMEPAATDPELSICMVEMQVKWLDVGSWPTYADTIERGERGNKLTGAGSTVVTDSHDNLVYNDVGGHTIALLGCSDLIVVHTSDATMIVPRDQADRLKELHGALPERLQ